MGQENSWKMEELFLTTTSRKSPLFIWFYVSEEECRFLSRLLLERPSLWKLSHLTPLKMRRPRFKTRRESHQISRGWSLQENSWKMAELFLTTTSRRSPLFTWFSVSEEECRSLSRLLLERPSLWKLSFLTTTSRRSPLFIWFFASEEECRSLSRLLLERLSLWKLSLLTPLKMLRPRFKTRRESHQISRG